MFCQRVLTIQGRIIMRSRIKAATAAYLKIVESMFFPEIKLENLWKKSFATPVAVKSNRECFIVFI